MHAKEWLGQYIGTVERHFIGPGKHHGHKPEIKKIVEGITTREQALARITESQAHEWRETPYLAHLYSQLVELSIKKAWDFGATDEEINHAVHQGNVLGAAARRP
jgi:hypothetical protein